MDDKSRPGIRLDEFRNHEKCRGITDPRMSWKFVIVISGCFEKLLLFFRPPSLHYFLLSIAAPLFGSVPIALGGRSVTLCCRRGLLINTQQGGGGDGQCFISWGISRRCKSSRKGQNKRQGTLRLAIIIIRRGETFVEEI